MGNICSELTGDHPDRTAFENRYLTTDPLSSSSHPLLTLPVALACDGSQFVLPSRLRAGLWMWPVSLLPSLTQTIPWVWLSSRWNCHEYAPYDNCLTRLRGDAEEGW